MNINDFFIYTLLIGGGAAWMITLAGKWGVIEWLAAHSNAFFNKMFNCGFCLSWWTCVIIAVAVTAFTGEGHMLFAPFFATMLTRRLL